MNPARQKQKREPMNSSRRTDERLRTDKAIIVEGRDDVDAVSRACDALIIPTHGFGITERTWELMDKAYRELGVIILTDPDHAGEDIRRRLTERYPDAVQCYMAREDAEKADDIGIENARPEDIRAAVERALELHEAVNSDDPAAPGPEYREVTMRDLSELGLTGSEGASQLRNAVTRELGIGYCNAKSLITRLRSFRIGYEELADAADKFRETYTDI